LSVGFFARHIKATTSSTTSAGAGASSDAADSGLGASEGLLHAANATSNDKSMKVRRHAIKLLNATPFFSVNNY